MAARSPQTIHGAPAAEQGVRCGLPFVFGFLPSIASLPFHPQDRSQRKTDANHRL